MFSKSGRAWVHTHTTEATRGSPSHADGCEALWELRHLSFSLPTVSAGSEAEALERTEIVSPVHVQASRR